MTNFRFQFPKSQSGQTLIETIVAIFLLTVALTTALGLAIYAFAVINTSQDQIVASNLAREGIDVIQYMRDTNWLEGDAAGGTFALQTCSDLNQPCYPSWLTGPSGNGFHNFNLSQANNPGGWQVQFNSTTGTWALSNSGNYNLYLQADGTYTPTVTGSSAFARKIVVTYNSASPYTAANPELIVKSTVAWRGKRCNWSGQDPAVATSNCKITVEEHLTNWKNYQ